MHHNPFIKFLESLRTPDNIDTLDTIIEGYQILYEVYGGTFQDPYDKDNHHTYFINPSRKEINELRKLHPGAEGIRLGITDDPNPTVYAWHGINSTHRDFMEATGNEFTFGLLAEWEANKLTLSTHWAWLIEKLNHNEAIKEKIEFLFPGAKMVDKDGEYVDLTPEEETREMEPSL